MKLDGNYRISSNDGYWQIVFIPTVTLFNIDKETVVSFEWLFFSIDIIFNRK